MTTVILAIVYAVRALAWGPIEIALVVSENPRASCKLVFVEVSTNDDWWRLHIPRCEISPGEGAAVISYSGFVLSWTGDVAE